MSLSMAIFANHSPHRMQEGVGSVTHSVEEGACDEMIDRVIRYEARVPLDRPRSQE